MNRVIFLLMLLMPLAPTAHAAELFGKVDAVTGAAAIRGDNGTDRPLAEGDSVYVGQNIVTGANGEVHIVTADSGLIALRPNSSFRIDRYQAKGDDTDVTAISLLKGALRSITGWVAKRNPSAYSLSTMTTTIGVRGTDHETVILEQAEGDAQPGTYDTVYEGATVMRNAQGITEVRAGESAYAARDARQSPALLARRPDFMERRMLRLEQRIQQRREDLREHIRNRLQARDSWPDTTEQRRERARRLHDRLIQRRQQ